MAGGLIKSLKAGGPADRGGRPDTILEVGRTYFIPTKSAYKVKIALTYIYIYIGHLAIDVGLLRI
jgi:hypothetical protein